MSNPQPSAQPAPANLDQLKSTAQAGLPLPAQDALALIAELEQAREDNSEYEAIFDVTSKILKDTANALNGPPPPLTTWSHHDLADKAAALKALSNRAQTLYETMVAGDNEIIHTRDLHSVIHGGEA